MRASSWSRENVISVHPHGYAVIGKILLGLADSEGAEVKDRRGEYGTRVSHLHAIDEVVQRTDAARGDDRDVHGIGDGAGQLEIEPRLGAVAVHRGHEQLARAAFDGSNGK